MVHHTTRNYTVSEIRQIVGLASEVSDLSSTHILGMVCLADLLNHLADQDGTDVETNVRGFFDAVATRPTAVRDDLDD